MQPDTSLLAEQVKTCLQESDEVPPDITSLFDNSLFMLDTSIVPKAIKYVYSFSIDTCVLVHASVNNQIGKVISMVLSENFSESLKDMWVQCHL